MDHAAIEALRVAVGRAVIQRMRWTQAAAADAAKHESVEPDGELTYVECKWADGAVATGVIDDECVDPDEYAEAIAADRKERFGRFGEQLPWR